MKSSGTVPVTVGGVVDPLYDPGCQLSSKPVLRDEDLQTLTQTSGLTEAQVRETFEAFVAEHPDGRFDKKQFRRMMQKALPEKDAIKMENHIFR